MSDPREILDPPCDHHPNRPAMFTNRGRAMTKHGTFHYCEECAEQFLTPVGMDLSGLELLPRVERFDASTVLPGQVWQHPYARRSRYQVIESGSAGAVVRSYAAGPRSRFTIDTFAYESFALMRLMSRRSYSIVDLSGESWGPFTDHDVELIRDASVAPYRVVPG